MVFNMKKTISFPHLGNYHVPVKILLRQVFPGHAIAPAPPTSKRTLELGARHSPDFVCLPFKYNLGNYIEALEEGAGILMQISGGCRFSYYAEVQEQILRDLGYRFRFVNLTEGGFNLKRLHQTCRELGSPLSFPRFLRELLLTAGITKAIDALERYMRENVGFELEEKSFENMHKSFLAELETIEGFSGLLAVYGKFSRAMRTLKTDKPPDCMKVGVVGELYTSMEPFSNFFLEKELAKNKIAVGRFMTACYLLFEKGLLKKRTLREAGGYLKYTIGADGAHSVAKSKMLADAGYDGLIHVKPFACTPEINAMPVLQKLSRERRIPILYFSFDAQTSETGVKTRLEAFNDVLQMRREQARQT
ncbi:MAG: hypothetical protein FWD39_01385 [Clostridiales bacterium]|nr:hypothetical protein [Clostridiales bacterium]